MITAFDEAIEYLETGGLAEVEGLAKVAESGGAQKVQMDTAMALALCELARQTLARRAAH
jgi:hypothetical protein